MSLLAFNVPPPPSHLPRDNEASILDPLKEKSSKVVVGEDATAVITGGAPLNNYPLVRLDVDAITDSIAGRLATSLLGHVLFLKNQIPFPVKHLVRSPVMRLDRMPRVQETNTRVDKQRTALLTSFDTISSHMDTTFSALSTALSRYSNDKESKITRAYLAILVGPSLGSAKSKVVLGIDGLEKRIWGTRTYISRTQETEDDENETHDPAAETEDDDSEEKPDDSESEEEFEQEESDEDEDNYENARSSSPIPTQRSHADEQKFLQNAERLLSRTLATADGDGRGIISELSPTQTHILIRAPRLFNHPAWIPRQNLSMSLNPMLNYFLNHSGLGPSTPLPHDQTKHSKKNHVEGVWVTTRAGIQMETTDNAPVHDQPLNQDDDDMIWWSWEGKLMGFSDL